MEKIPLEIKVIIFKQLDLKNLLKLRTLNKNLRHIIDNFFGIENLAITSEPVQINDFYGLDQLVECCFIPEERLMNKKYLKNRYFAKIKRLVFESEFDLDLDNLLYRISKFDFLVSFEIRRLNVEKSEINFEFSSRNLKYLKIGFVYFYDKMDQKINFNTPKLTHMKFTSLNDVINRFTFTHPESVKCLSIYRYVEDILNFSNLEHLFVEDAYFFMDEFYSTNLLIQLPKLKDFYLFGSPRMFENLIKKKAEMNMTRPNIYYSYVKANDLDDFNKLVGSKIFNSCGRRYNLKEYKFLIDNFTNLSETIEIDFCYYHYIDKIYKGKNLRTPIEFINKFQSLTTLVLYGAVRLDGLYDLLKNSKLIKHITISNHKKQGLLPNEFFRELPMICAKLEKLKIFNHEEIEFDFLLDFEVLKSFSSDQLIPKEIAAQLFLKNQKAFSTFSFRSEGIFRN